MFLPYPGEVGNSWVRDDLIPEFRDFPNGAHDDQCLVGETMILTDRGPKCLDKVRVGDRVRSMTGWATVLEAGMTNSAAEITERFGLRGTASHPVWVNGEWTPLSRVVSYDELWTLARTKDAIGLWTSPATAGAGAATSAGGNYLSHGPRHLLRSALGSLGRVRSAARNSRPSRDRGVAYAETVGSIVTTSESRRSRTEASSSGDTRTHLMERTGTTSSRPGSMSRQELRRSTVRSTGITTDPYPTDTTCTILMVTPGTTIRQTSSPFPEGSTWNSRGTGGEVKAGHGGIMTRCSRTWKRFVRRLWSGIGLPKDESGTASTLGRSGEIAPVYNLRTTDGTYFANGILVHNCDALTQALWRLRTSTGIGHIANPNRSRNANALRSRSIGRTAIAQRRIPGVPGSGR